VRIHVAPPSVLPIH